MLTKIFSFIFNRTLWSFVGILSICYLIWVLGPVISINQWYPLADDSVRLIIIAIILFITIFRFSWNKWRERRLNAKLFKEIVKPTDIHKDSHPAGVREELQVLVGKFADAVSILNETNVDQTTVAKFFSKFSTKHLYQLPWYVFIGAPGSGKTTALVNSGLNFPTEDKFGRVAFKGVGGTRNCDWWFTNEAVLLDTAGRYTTHETDKLGDEEEWLNFLTLLTKYRKRQPINGVILTVSVQELLSFTDSEREMHAVILKKRLNELYNKLGITFPIYILVSKIDFLNGFEDYFYEYSNESLKQVWGFTFPYKDVTSGKFNLLQEFNVEYDYLLDRIYKNLPNVLIKEKSIVNRKNMYLFVQQLADFKNILSSFLNQVFNSSNFEKKLNPRGVYFTSGCQIRDQFTADLEKASIPHLKQTQTQIDYAKQDKNKSFFLHDLLTKIVFKEANLAGINLKWLHKFKTINRIGYMLISLAFIITLFAWFTSYYRNIDYLNYVNNKVYTLKKQPNKIKSINDKDIFSIIFFMNQLEEIPNGNDFDYRESPISYSYGLYQGNKLHSASKSVYNLTAKNVLLPKITKMIENILKNSDDNNIDLVYEALRAYLMLYDSQNYNKDFLNEWIIANLYAQLPKSYTTIDYNKFRHHIDTLTNEILLTSSFNKDAKLIEKKRSVLDKYPFYQRVYIRAKKQLSALDLPLSTLISLGGSEITTILNRDSKTLNNGVQGLFSYNGYWNIFNKRINDITNTLLLDDKWVIEIDQSKTPDFDFNRVVNDIKKIYFNDYVQYWDEFLQSISVRQPENLLGYIELVRAMSAKNSALVLFMHNVGMETTLLREDANDQRSKIDVLLKKVKEPNQASLNWLVGNTSFDENSSKVEGKPLELLVDEHFSKYREYNNLNKNQNVKDMNELLNGLYNYLVATDVALRTKTLAPPSDVLVKLQAEAGRMPKLLSDVISKTANNSSSVIDKLNQNQLGEDIHANLGRFCQQAIAGRYPFRKNSTKDVAIGDMWRFFGQQQMMDGYFQKNLAHLVDQSSSNWKFKPSMNVNLIKNAKYLSSFQKAEIIKNTFFNSDKPMLAFKVIIKPLEMDSNISQLIFDVDGQTITYEHGPQISYNIDWPSQRGLNSVSLNIESNGSMSGLSTSGVWALHRLLDKAVITKGNSPEKVIATFNINGKKIKMEIIANSIYNPFYLAEMRNFSCPGDH